jgi:hypothetical protein
MRYLKKYVRFFEASTEVAPEVEKPEVEKPEVEKPEIDIPTASAEDVVERLSRIYSGLDKDAKDEIDSYFE